MDFRAWQRAAGPGIIFSGAAIGVSHLVQSTRAGAMFGLALVGVIILINLLKYPAFRFGMDYAHATRKTLIGGYRELAPWLVLLVAAMALSVSPIGLAAVSATTAAILAALTGVELPFLALVVIVIGATILMLLVGGYGWLDHLSKFLIAFLSLATVTAAALALPRVNWASAVSFEWTMDPLALLFVVALAGFMPSAIGQSVDISIWTLKSQEDEADSDRLPMGTMRNGFLSAYALTTFLAICFCIMGAGVMHSGGVTPESGAAELATQIINLYKETLGPIPAYLAAIAAFCVMVTTMVASFDGAARGIGALYQEYQGNVGGRASNRQYAFFLVLLAVLCVGALIAMKDNFADFIDLVTSIFFVLTPGTALLNHLVITRCEMPEEHRPSRAMRLLSLTGIVVMTAMSVMFFVLKAG
ncbi:divalent metal cation transporter [Pontixanthobacter sp. CEM42]|uniref:NRAMP family divalent metal transporter n=1 Tax=Pontixanthobacter sp. CEM42 TaxID=2792077 RepID=UPI001AE00C17|nr:divalent metal cation transporter [Pontixanthobacter sp. CEM42]